MERMGRALVLISRGWRSCWRGRRRVCVCICMLDVDRPIDASTSIEGSSVNQSLTYHRYNCV